MKRHFGFIIFFTFIIFFFLGKLIFMKAAFIYGDYLVQFYPWSKIYSEAIKEFSFPFWTRYFNSGFPLMAEGQIGGFYPLNIIMFFLLPFKVAYNYSVILHFILAGIFTYIYARKLGADQGGGALSALLFCFGSAYAGCFYNTVTVRTVAWFPLVLFLFEKYFENKKFRYIFWSGVVLGIQLLAGFTQMAIYSAVFYLIYFVSGLLLRRSLKFIDIIRIGIVNFLAVVIFYPQFILSWQLFKLSTRQDATLGFALWGSFNPFNFMSICFPYAVFYGTRFYIGIFTILFLITAILCLKKELKLCPLFIILLISIFLALGAFNPLYAFLLKITRLYSLRNPSKLIFFGVFSASVLSGWGFTKFFASSNEHIRKQGLKIFAVFVSIALGLFFLMKIILYFFGDQIIKAGEWYVMRYIAGKPFHRYSLATYFDKVKNFCQLLIENSSLFNKFIIISILFCFIALFISRYLLKNKKSGVFLKPFFIGILFIDLFVFSFYGTGFRGNIKSFKHIKPAHNKILEILNSDKSIFRILPFDLLKKNTPWWNMPNANILVGLESIASYTPLIQKSYKDALSSLEVVDDSLGLLSPEDEALSGKYQLLRLLNVKYILSSRKLESGFLEEIIKDEGLFLYKIKDYLPRIFFTSGINKEIDEEHIEYLKIIKYESGFAEMEVVLNKEGFLVFSENYYPGWSVYVDGKKIKLLKAWDLVQAVAIKNGYHKVAFKYKPIFFSKK
jgi:hypothetical protein